jgi:hypothetical protein
MSLRSANGGVVGRSGVNLTARRSCSSFLVSSFTSAVYNAAGTMSVCDAPALIGLQRRDMLIYIDGGPAAGSGGHKPCQDIIIPNEVGKVCGGPPSRSQLHGAARCPLVGSRLSLSGPCEASRE